MAGPHTNNSAQKTIGRAELASFPKIEVHRHLEGTYPIETLFRIAVKNELDVPRDLEAFKAAFQFPKDHEPDFLLFLSKFKKFWYKSLDDVETLTYESVKSFVDDGLHYIELRFNPLHFTELTGFDPKDVVTGIIGSGDRAAKETGLKIKYQLTFNRGVQTAAEMLATYEELQKIDLSRVVGIDLAGDETNYPPELFVDFFEEIHREGRFGIDIHAGEVTDSRSMWVSIEKLHANRIGHGVAAIKDKKIQKVLTDENIFLAQCITSNYQTGAWVDSAKHPMGRLIKKGVPVCIASDDPTVQDSDLTDDYVLAHRYFGWGVDELTKINLNSVETCFLNPEEKITLKSSYLQAVEAFRSEKNL